MDNEGLSMSEDPPVLSEDHSEEEAGRKVVAFKETDNEDLSLTEDSPVLRNHSEEGAGRKVLAFSRFLSKTDEDEIFKIQKKVCNILHNE